MTESSVFDSEYFKRLISNGNEELAYQYLIRRNPKFVIEILKDIQAAKILMSMSRGKSKRKSKRKSKSRKHKKSKKKKSSQKGGGNSDTPP